MRLRRENGDFDFNIDYVTRTGKIPANLFPEQLIGQIVFIDRRPAIVIDIGIADDNSEYLLIVGNGTECIYNVATGAVRVVGGMGD